MHPRNIYKDPPDFKELAEKYQELRAVAHVDFNGKVKINFKDPKAVRALTRCLLQRDFNLDIILDEDKLVPTLPLRLNYILWLEDILNNCNFITVTGLDVGCGASCVYPLLAAQYKKWNMIGVDIDEKSIQLAIANITRNNLQERVSVYKNTEDNILAGIIKEYNLQNINFTMCNPPFFDLNNNVQNRSGKRKKPNNAPTGCRTELTVDGGEVKFIKRMIAESIELKDQISIFSTMVGQKSSFTEIKKYLQTINITNVVTTVFEQGKTSRWGIAWTHSHNFPLNSNISLSTELTNVHRRNNLLFIVANEDKKWNFETIICIIRKLLCDLKMQLQLVEKNKKSILWRLTAFENTWSHQRKKRREQQQKPTALTTNENKNSMPSDEEDNINSKKIKSDGINSNPLLIFSMLIDSDLSIEMNYCSGTLGRDGVNQVLQYIKNNYNKEN